MSETKKISFSYQEVVECLLKHQGIHEGLWSISFAFELGAASVSKPDDKENYFPAAIIPITSIGLRRVDELDNLSVDAAEVNPRPKSKSDERVAVKERHIERPAKAKSKKS